jgi:hypothetical protein
MDRVTESIEEVPPSALEAVADAPIFGRRATPANLLSGGSMSFVDQLHFRRLPAESRRAALWRLALSGLTAEEVAAQTGISLDEVRRVMEEASEPYPIPARAAAAAAAAAATALAMTR